MIGQLRIGTQRVAPTMAVRTLVRQENIEAYKAMDTAAVLLEGGTIPTDEEYEVAETQLQQIYKTILEGGSQNE